jgi:hypothetical protein
MVAEVQPETLAPVNVDTPGMPAKVTEDDMLRVLWRHFTAQSWFLVPQVSTLADDEENTYRDQMLRRIDALAVRKPRKQGIGAVETLAIEVKVTREDWKRDLDNPGKQQAWRDAAHRHVYAVPAGLVHPDETPEGSGLLTVAFTGSTGYGTVEWAKRIGYPVNNPERPIPDGTLRTMFARLAQLEGKTRGWSFIDGLSGDTEDLRAAHVALQRTAEKMKREKERAEGQRDAWRELFARTHPKGAPCRWCGEPVKGLRPTGGWFKSWRHVNSAHDGPCALLEEAAAEEVAREEYAIANDSDRRTAARMAEYRWANYGDKHPSPDRLEADPWLAFLDRVHQVGPVPVDVIEEPEE